MPEPSEPDALRAVRKQLDEAHAAADRLVREAQRQAEDVPAELSRQLAEALRQLLLALRALLDWYIERLGEADPGRGGVEVEDIPLD